MYEDISTEARIAKEKRDRVTSMIKPIFEEVEKITKTMKYVSHFSYDGTSVKISFSPKYGEARDMHISVHEKDIGIILKKIIYCYKVEIKRDINITYVKYFEENQYFESKRDLINHIIIKCKKWERSQVELEDS